MDDTTMDQMLSGDLRKLSPLPKRVVRLFISSTFTDMTLERNSLMERVYPRLKKYCRERYGLDFQVVDMRWGVRDEATDDHQTVNLCSREINNCQRVSLGPNFVALIGDKYGFRPLLNRIKSTEYRLLRRCLIESDTNTDFLDTWYKEDLNAVPAEYVLQPISSILKNFANKNEPELQMVDQRIWQAIQERLHDLLLIGSNRLVKQGRMSEREQMLKYSISVTEREVIEGCLDVNDAKSHCLVYVRSIVDLRDHLIKCIQDLSSVNSSNQLLSAASSPSGASNGVRRNSIQRKASLKMGKDTISLTTSGAQTVAGRKIERTRRLIGRYIDLTSKEGAWKVDEDAQEALKELKEVKLNQRLAMNKRNLTVYRVHWNEQDGISVKSDEHKTYLSSLTDHFYGNLTRMIRSAVKSERGKTNTKGLVGEVLQHSHYALQLGKSVHSRSDEIDQIRAYILTYASQQQRARDGSPGAISTSQVLPMLVFGLSGVGKTSVLARVASLAHEWVQQARKRRHSSAGLEQQQNDVTGSSQQQQQQQTAIGTDPTKRWDRKPCIIVRFCCTTPASSSMVGMLTSVCRQLQYNFYQFGPLNGLIDHQQQQSSSQLRSLNASAHDGAERRRTTNQEPKKTIANTQLPYRPIPQDFVRLVYTFHQLIDNCHHPLHRRRLFVIILDSIERLSSPGETSVEAKYSWLTSIGQLPPNVRLIVSCSATSEGTAMHDYLHLKRHFLQAHHSSLIKRLNLLSLLNDETEIGSGASNSSSASSASSSLDLDQASSIREESDSGKLTVAYGRQQSKYGPLLKRLVLPSIQLKRVDSTGTTGTPILEGAAAVASHRTRTTTSTREAAVKFMAPNRGSRLGIGGQWSSSSSRADKEHHYDYGIVSGEHEIISGGAYFKPSQPNQSPPMLGLLHIRPLGKEVAMNVLRRWLNESGRNLTQQQWSIVERSFAHCSRPIFVKLAFGEVMNWKSYSTQGDTKGLTFGSAWLTDLTYTKNSDTSSADDGGTLVGGSAISERDQLMQIVQQYETTTDLASNKGAGHANDDEKLKWQMLAMEQQWLNYIDYRSSLEQRTNQSGAAISGTPDDSGNLIIRIGSSGRTTDAATSESNQQQLAATKHVNDNSSINLTASNSTGAAGSGSSMSICHLSSTIEDAICQLFARIELQHGYLLTKHSLSYITAACNGICENELEDILSLDDVVLDDVFQYHLPPVRRIPPLLWTRIRNDLPDYLSERDADGIVITWHHNQFKSVTEKRYLSETKQAVYIHSLLADYFLGKWADKAKPFKCTRQQIQMAAEQLESSVQQSMQDGHHQASTGGGGGGSSLIGPFRQGSGSGRPGGSSFSVRNRLRSSDQHDARLQWAQAKAHRQVPHQPLYYDTTTAATVSAATTTNTAKTTGLGRARPTVARNESAQGESLNDDVDNSQSSRLNYAAEASAHRHERRVRYNMRKLTELPHHLMRSGRFNELASCVLFNYKWLIASIDALGMQSVFSDLDRALKCLEAKLAECHQSEASETRQQQQRQLQLDLQLVDCVPSDELDPIVIRSMLEQLTLLSSTLRLSASVIHSNAHMLAPQLVGRLVSVVERHKWAPISTSEAGGSSSSSGSSGNLPKQPQRRHEPASPIASVQLKRAQLLAQLIQQCDKDGCSDCSLLPTDHCLQSPDGLQLSSLEGHPFGVMSMVLASDQRHLLAVSSKFIMWNISTGEIAREIDPKLNGSIMKELTISLNNQFALAYTSDQAIIVLDILTQQVVKYEHVLAASGKHTSSGEQILGLKLIDSIDASRFLIWTSSRWLVLRLSNDSELEESDYRSYNTVHDKSGAISVTLEHEIDCRERLPALVKCRLLDLEVMPNTNNASNRSYRVFSTVSQSIGDEANPSADNLIRFITVDVVLGQQQTGASASVKELVLWADNIQAASLALGPCCKQLVYSTQSGCIYLTRRRATCWSKPKLLRASPVGHKSTSVKMVNSRQVSPLAIEIDTSAGGEIQSSQTRVGLTSDAELYELAHFERKVDKVVEDGRGDMESVGKVFGEHLRQQDGTTTSTSGRSRQSLAAGQAERIRYVKLYWSECITVIKFDHSDGQVEKCLSFPRDIRNVRIGPNKCQLTSVIMGANGGQQNYLSTANTNSRSGSPVSSKPPLYLIAAASKKLLVYSIEDEQLLKCIDAHSGRITKLLPIGHLVENLVAPTKVIASEELGACETRNGSAKEAGATRVGLATRQLSIASSSFDKTVKIWNLLNIAREGQSIDRLDSGQIDSMYVCSQRPLVACLSRGQLSIWDWRTMKIVASPQSVQDVLNRSMLASNISTSTSSPQSDHIKPSSSQSFSSLSIIKCKFSTNGRNLAAATIDSVLVLAIGGRTASQQPTNERSSVRPDSMDALALSLVARCPLPDVGLLYDLKFIGQDSRLVAIQQCCRLRAPISHKRGSRSPPGGTPPPDEQSDLSSKQTTTRSIVDEEPRLSTDLVVSCYTLTDSRLQYSIECQVPKCKSVGEYSGKTAVAGSSSASRGRQQNDTIGPDGCIDSLELSHAKRRRLAVITCDQQFVVVVANCPAATDTSFRRNSVALSSNGPRSPQLSRAPLVLNVFSTRDGSLVRSIDLQRLQTADYQHQYKHQQNDSLSSRRTPKTVAGNHGQGRESVSSGNVLQVHAQPAEPESETSGRRSQVPKQSAPLQQTVSGTVGQEFVSINGDQFNRLKAISQGERQTLVALIDDERGANFIVDIATKLLVSYSNLWSGKLSSDGRYGLSKMFASSSASLASKASSSEPTFAWSAAGKDDLELSSGGLRLLEMRRCRPVKSLLTIEQLNKLQSASEIQSTGGGAGTSDDHDLLYGFTRPNDAYVYCCDLRLKRLLLIRVRDSQLVANYKLSNSVTTIKCSSDGYALLLAQTDGSLTSLAIVDPQTSDTLTRLSQYPSRRRLNFS